jgi:hypothetical protein
MPPATPKGVAVLFHKEILLNLIVCGTPWSQQAKGRGWERTMTSTRYLMLLGLVLVAFGASATTASATTLCTVNVNPCPAGNRYPEKQNLNASLVAGTVFTVQYGTVTVKCNESSFTSETQKNEGVSARLLTEIGTWTLAHNGGACETAGGVKCTVNKWVNLPYKEAGVYAEGGGGSGSLKVEKNSAKLELVCSGVKCVYNLLTLKLEFKGGGAGAARLVLNKATMGLSELESSEFCGKTATLSAEYKVTTPATAVWVSESP